MLTLSGWRPGISRYCDIEETDAPRNYNWTELSNR